MALEVCGRLKGGFLAAIQNEIRFWSICLINCNALFYQQNASEK